jgi:DNA-binding transcriptional MerR regulator
MFKIGEFSRLSRVSIRMLRHYDQRGLLKPSQTDPFTGYRYYSADQLPRLNRILALRDLGFSLEQIGGLLDEDLPPEQMLGMLRLRRAEVEQQMQTESARLARLEARMHELNGQPSSTAYDVILRQIEPQLVAALREIVSDDDRIQYMFEEVETYVAEAGARADRPPLTIFYDPDYREQDIDAEVAIPLKNGIPGSGAIQVRELEAIPAAACVVHNGSYATIDHAYNALLAWVDGNGYRLAGPIREVYLRFGAEGLGFDLPPTYLAKEGDDFVTELQLPVEKSAA